MSQEDHVIEIQNSEILHMNLGPNDYVIIKSEDKNVGEIILSAKKEIEKLKKEIELLEEENINLRTIADKPPVNDMIITSKSVVNKGFHDLKKDIDQDNTTMTIFVKGTRMDNKERELILEYLNLDISVNEFIEKIKVLKGIFLLDPDILSRVIYKYDTKIYKIIDTLGYNYHLCYMSESIYKQLYDKNSNIDKISELMKKNDRNISLKLVLFLAAFLVASFVIMLVYVTSVK